VLRARGYTTNLNVYDRNSTKKLATHANSAFVGNIKGAPTPLLHLPIERSGVGHRTDGVE
jgi:hypothetical protein